MDRLTFDGNYSTERMVALMQADKDGRVVVLPEGGESNA